MSSKTEAVRIPRQHAAQVRDLARRTGLTMSEIAGVCIRCALTEPEPKHSTTDATATHQSTPMIGDIYHPALIRASRGKQRHGVVTPFRNPRAMTCPSFREKNRV